MVILYIVYEYYSYCILSRNERFIPETPRKWENYCMDCASFEYSAMNTPNMEG